MLSGLGRMGWSVPLSESYVHHGAIMAGGFLGSLIALEKVIPLKKPYFYTGPLLSACSVVAFITGHFSVALFMLIGASVLFVFVYLTYLRTQTTLYLLIALAGSVCWVVGNVLLLWKRFYPMAFPWWMAFILLIIVSERLELLKFLPVSNRSKHRLILFLGFFIAGILFPFHETGRYVSGASLVFVAAWLLRNDVVSVTMKKEGLLRYTAVALVCGYIALLLEGVFLVVIHDMALAYDIILHTFFIGFVFAMIFAHGPIILPGVLGLSVRPYHPLFYLPLVLLFISLGFRIAADAMLIPIYFRALSGWTSAGSILLYFALMITFTLRAVRHASAA